LNKKEEKKRAKRKKKGKEERSACRIILPICEEKLHLSHPEGKREEGRRRDLILENKKKKGRPDETTFRSFTSEKEESFLSPQKKKGGETGENKRGSKTLRFRTPMSHQNVSLHQTEKRRNRKKLPRLGEGH